MITDITLLIKVTSINRGQSDIHLDNMGPWLLKSDARTLILCRFNNNGISEELYQHHSSQRKLDKGKAEMDKRMIALKADKKLINAHLEATTGKDSRKWRRRVRTRTNQEGAGN